MSRLTRLSVLVLPLIVGFSLPTAFAETADVGEVRAFRTVDTEGTGDVLDDEDYFAVPAPIGDLDDDGVEDLAVGALRDDDGGTDRGAVWILFMRDDGSVRARRKISSTEGGFSGTLDDGAVFGTAVAGLDDLDGDGIEDIAVGAPVALADCGNGCDVGGPVGEGAVWILFLNRDGTVKSQVEISADTEELDGELDPCDRFGISIAALGNLDNDVDGTTDIAIGANSDDNDDANECDTGAVYIVFLTGGGGVKNLQKISDADGGFDGNLETEDIFGTGVAFLGGLAEDGSPALAVGAPQEDSGGTGEVWILFLSPGGTVMDEQKIECCDQKTACCDFEGCPLEAGDSFGFAVARVGDVNGDGVGDLAVTARQDDDAHGGGSNRGAVWILFLRDDGTVKSEAKISDTCGGFKGTLDEDDSFGLRTAARGDLDAGGPIELAVGALTDDGGPDRGAVWLLDVNVDGTVTDERRISETEGGFGEITGDVTDNGIVDFADILVLLGSWGDCPKPPEGCPADLDQSGVVDFADLLIVLANWT